MRRPEPIVALGLSVILLCGSVLALFAEMRPFRFATGMPVERFEALMTAPMPTALSVPANRRAMLTCLEAVTGLYGRARPVEQRRQVARACELGAHQVLRRNPASGLAWLVSAAAAGIDGNAPAYAARLGNSAKVTPSEQWLAAARLRLPDRLTGDLPVAGTGLEADIKLLAGTHVGRQILARRYAGDPAFATHVLDAVEQLDEGTQTRVVHAIRALVVQRTGEGS